MTKNKPIWTLFLIFISITASTILIFRLETFALEIAILSGFVLMGIIGLYGLFENRLWGNGIMLVLFACILINIGYLSFYIPYRGILFPVATLASLVGLITSFPHHRQNKKSVLEVYKRKQDEIAVVESKKTAKKVAPVVSKKPIKANKKAPAKKAVKKKTAKKAVKKKTAKKTPVQN
jgi:hypothetical protein